MPKLKDISNQSLTALSEAIAKTEIPSEKTALMDNFLQGQQYKILIEDNPENPKTKRLTFLWPDPNKKFPNLRLRFFGGVDIHDSDEIPKGGNPEYGMTPIPGIGWAMSCELPSDARIAFDFAIIGEDDGKSRNRADPTWRKLQTLMLPDADPQPWLDADNTGKEGSLIKFSPKFSKDPWVEAAPEEAARDISVYLPHGYDPHRTEPYPLIVCLDSREFVALMNMTKTLDNLISAGAIPPTIVTFVNCPSPQSKSYLRETEYQCNEKFSSFLTDELVPKLRSEFRITEDPSATTIMGVSFSGLGATNTALHHPETFGKVLSLSGAFWWHPDFKEDASSSPARWLIDHCPEGGSPVRFYLTAGTQETSAPCDLLGSNLAMAAELRECGHQVQLTTFNGNHHPVYWQGAVADGLISIQNPVLALDPKVSSTCFFQAHQTKSEPKLKDHTKTDPYGPGAIVPYGP